MCEIKNLLFADCKRTFNQRINRYNLRHLPDLYNLPYIMSEVVFVTPKAFLFFVKNLEYYPC